MHDEVSETENIRKNLAIERMIVEGCEILLDTSQTFVRQGKLQFFYFLLTGLCVLLNAGSQILALPHPPSITASKDNYPEILILLQ